MADPNPTMADTFDELAGSIRAAGAALRAAEMRPSDRDMVYLSELALNAIEKGEAALDAFNAASRKQGEE
ncbi:MAG: hypothetical protein AB7G25_04625 [Sphingomonadaceae bacterium]